MNASDIVYFCVKDSDGRVLMEVGKVEPEATPFWIVLRDPKNPNATVRHYDVNEARKEADRLCIKYNAPFWVLRVEPEGYAEPRSPRWVPV
jgi:hypothetical protein